MQTLRKLAQYLRRSLADRTAWLLACLHGTWFVTAVANMSPPNRGFASLLENGGWSSAALFAGRPFHFHYESLALKLLLLCDMPALLASSVLSFVFAVPFTWFHHLGMYSASYLSAASLLLVGTAQWLLIGHAVHSWLERREWGIHLNRAVARYFVLLVATIAIFTAVIAPIINERSRQSGVRHAEISFRK